MTEPTLSPSSIQLIRLPRPNPWQELAYLSMFFLELSWIIPWYTLLAAPSEPAVVLRSVLAFGGILAATNLILRVFDALEIKKKLRRWVFVFLLGFSLFYGLKLLVFFNETMSVRIILSSFIEALNAIEPQIPAEFVVILLVIATAYRGAVLAGGQAVPSMVSGNMRLGLILLSLVGFLAAITRRTIPGAIMYLLIFLFASLLGMVAARIYVMAQLRGGQGLPFERQRVAGLVLAVLGLVILAGLAGLFLSSAWGSDLVLGLIGLVGLLIRWLASVIVILLYPLIVIIFSVVQWFASHLAPHLLNLSQNQQMDEALKKLQETASRQPLFVVDIRLLRPILLGGLIVLAVVSVVLLIRSRSGKGKGTGMGETEALLSTDDLLKLILASARKNAQAMLDRLAERLGLHKDSRRLAAQRIRAIYADLLDLAARLKYPRWPQQTPLEYLPELQKAFPGSQSELALITRAYQRIRYGELPETQAEVNAIESAWKQVQMEGQRILVNSSSRRP